MLSPSERRGAALSGALALLLGFAPQLAGPGYDSALIAGALWPAQAGVVAALATLRDAGSSAWAAFQRGLRSGALLWSIALVISLLHGLRVGLCDASEGLLLWILGPGFGCLLGGVCGAAAAEWVSRRKLKRPRATACLLALLGPLLGIFISLLRFYTSPMVFAYDPFFGYFSGPLYDTVIGSLSPLLSYRLGTLCSLSALGILASELDWPEGATPRLRRRLPWGKFAALCGLGLGSLAVTAFGTELGHASTQASIQRELGRELQEGRCRVVYSKQLLARDARRVGRECHAHLAQIERFFEVSGPAQVTVFLFANDVEKGRLMGAAHTYIAKPWRHEVYIQTAGFPHPVLGHELAHVVSGSFGQGPFEVAGKFAGLWPDPGRIEGIATAASPDENDALTLEEWAAAMKQLKLLPPLASLFQFGFFGRNAAQAYTVSGAFVRFLRQNFGAAAIRRWYGGETLPEATGKGLPELERLWHVQLDGVSLSRAALAAARSRFERPAFFARACPRVIDRELSEAQARLQQANFSDARQKFEGVLDLDPHDSSARLGLAACQARSGQLSPASEAYRKLEQAGDAAPWARLQALEARGDLALRSGDLAGARSLYSKLAERVVDEDRLRGLEVKQLAEPGLAQAAIVSLLIGDELGPAWDVAAPRLGEWSVVEPENGLSDYLLAKNLFGRGRAREALHYAERASKRQLPEPRVRDEALRVQVLAACWLNEPGLAQPAYAALRERNLTRAKRAALDRLAERCRISAG